MQLVNPKHLFIAQTIVDLYDDRQIDRLTDKKNHELLDGCP